MKSAIENLFSEAAEAGFLKPTLRTKHLIFSRAPATGKNPGAVYIKTKQAEYAGKIINSEIHLLREFFHHREEITEAMNSPQQAAIKYGRETGQCSACGRRLDNAISIYNAIGPICAEKLGFPLLPVPQAGSSAAIDISNL